MTEAEWNACTDPKPMLEFLRGKDSDRKLRLFACGCSRQVWKSLTLKPVRLAVETAERYADGSVNALDLSHAYMNGISAFAGPLDRNMVKMKGAASDTKIHRMGLAVNTAHEPPFQMVRMLGFLDKADFPKGIIPILLRCIVNPFRPVTIAPAWLAWNNGTVAHLAQAIYEERAFDRMPILADALEEAGCHDPDILAHCRGPGPHVRGCWVVDLLTGKE